MAAGASEDTAVSIVRTLRAAGLRVGEARVWLTNRSRGYPVWTPRWAWQQVPAHAISDGDEDLVLAAAERFAAATADQRRLVTAFGCDVESARRLCGDDPDRARTMVEILGVLRETFSEAQVAEILYVRPARPTARAPERVEPRMLDEMYGGNERQLLQRLRAGAIDLEALLTSGMLELSHVPGEGSGVHPDPGAGFDSPDG